MKRDILTRAVAATLSIVLLVGTVGALHAEEGAYRVILTDGSETICSIVSNDPPSKRLQVQVAGESKLQWISYYRIVSIVEEASQKDVTAEFVVVDSVITPEAKFSPEKDAAAEPQPQAVQSRGMGSGAVITISILGTIAALVVLGAMAN